jgi:hypothetical protein
VSGVGGEQADDYRIHLNGTLIEDPETLRRLRAMLGPPLRLTAGATFEAGGERFLVERADWEEAGRLLTVEMNAPQWLQPFRRPASKRHPT